MTYRRNCQGLQTTKVQIENCWLLNRMKRNVASRRRGNLISISGPTSTICGILATRAAAFSEEGQMPEVS